MQECPSCGGRAEILDFDVSGDKLWQVSCGKCGLATEMDDERAICIQHWNRRDGEEKLRTKVTILGVLVPLGMAMSFLVGLLFGLLGGGL
nr:Lar family restriction alleviation protein [Sansalvadorimonas sp. 2012CJ34-2]